MPWVAIRMSMRSVIDHCFGKHGPQVRAFESNRHGCDLQENG